ncbi:MULTISPECIES: peptide deformylase [Actinoalloteichus]|uniref:Peptide deformylase n=1 Tax=Actinoalloteichus fjordicus TaxID=1612552 RepID=A0AAC9LBY5_9PSEU|nr:MULTISPECIES: peptide deformylase [Actinoalloteichus]APU14516.1 peptide deformylase [Actinoalloteichus fjordicus]APU20484.1 peptide deformylase [Actinoalloteichus sp. GBA129-24]
MSVQPITFFGDPVLRTRAREVVDFDKALRALVQDLWDTMEQQGGAGIAAPQIGVGRRVFAYHCAGHAGHLVNPTVRLLGHDLDEEPEGCLSIPGMSRPCRRANRVLATGWNVHGEAVQVQGEGLLARCLQHEIDHLDGVLYIDRLSPDTAARVMRDIRQTAWFDGDDVSTEELSPALARRY